MPDWIAIFCLCNKYSHQITFAVRQLWTPVFSNILLYYSFVSSFFKSLADRGLLPCFIWLQATSRKRPDSKIFTENEENFLPFIDNNTTTTLCWHYGYVGFHADIAVNKFSSRTPARLGNMAPALPTRSAGPNPTDRKPPARAASIPAAASSTTMH